MQEKIEALLQEISSYSSQDKQGVEAFRLKYISKKGVVGELFENLKQIPAEQKNTAGKILNELKQAAEAKFAALNQALEEPPAAATELDLTLPPIPNQTGNLHPLSLTK